MGPKKVQISQEAFNAVVKENVEEFDMELAEALEDAIKTFQMQGADLSGSNSLLHNKHLSFFFSHCHSCILHLVMFTTLQGDC